MPPSQSHPSVKGMQAHLLVAIGLEDRPEYKPHDRRGAYNDLVSRQNALVLSEECPVLNPEGSVDIVEVVHRYHLF